MEMCKLRDHARSQFHKVFSVNPNEDCQFVYLVNWFVSMPDQI